MLLRFFRSTGAQIIFFIPFVGVLLWLHSAIKAPSALFLFDKHPMLLYKFISDLLPATSIVATILTLSFVIIQGFWLVRLNTRFIFINNRTYMPALLFVLFCTSIPDLQRLNPVILSGFFLLLALEKIFESHRTDKLAYEYFVAGLYISIGSLLYAYLFFFIFFIWVGHSILKSYNWREWMFTILGFLTPLLFVFSYYYLVHDDPLHLYNDYKEAFSIDYHYPYYHPSIIVFVGFIILLIMVASQFMLRTFQSKKILPRKAFTVIFWLFINTLAVFILVHQASVELIFLAAIPVSYLLANYFTFMRSNTWGNLFLLILMILIIWIQM